jgi:SAM-dependent methyltransferase
VRPPIAPLPPLEEDPRVSGGRPATLAEVYPIDFGRRNEDRDLWSWAIRNAATEIARSMREDLRSYPLHVIEIGCGDGRIYRLLGDQVSSVTRWTGIDLSPEMIARFMEHDPMSASFGDPRVGILGDAAEEDVWRLIPLPATLILIPFSTLFLLPHAAQERMLMCAREALAPEGRILIETFIPRWTEDQEVLGFGGVLSPDGDEPDLWARRSLHRVRAADRITEVVRVYGPIQPRGGIEMRMRISETIYWRTAPEMERLLQETGFQEIERIGWPTCPAGFTVHAARR